MENKHAFELGVSARSVNCSVGMNPFSPDSEVENYEAWTDGWCEEDTECRNYEAGFKS